MKKNHCIYCGRDIGINIEFGGTPVHFTMGTDGFTCSPSCRDNSAKQISAEMSAEFGGGGPPYNWDL